MKLKINTFQMNIGQSCAAIFALCDSDVFTWLHVIQRLVKVWST